MWSDGESDAIEFLNKAGLEPEQSSNGTWQLILHRALKVDAQAASFRQHSTRLCNQQNPIRSHNVQEQGRQAEAAVQALLAGSSRQLPLPSDSASGATLGAVSGATPGAGLGAAGAGSGALAGAGAGATGLAGVARPEQGVPETPQAQSRQVSPVILLSVVCRTKANVLRCRQIHPQQRQQVEEYVRGLCAA